MKKIIPFTLLFLFIFVLIKNRVKLQDPQTSAKSENTGLPQKIGITDLPPGTYKVIKKLSCIQEAGSYDSNRITVEIETISDPQKKVTKIYWVQPSQMHDDYQVGDVFKRKPGDMYSTYQNIP